MRTINFRGKITTLEPLTVALKSNVSTSGHRLPRNGGYTADPYFPGTSIRGALRHAAHQVVVDRVTEENGGVVPFDLADHFMLAQGVDITGRTEAVRSGVINAGEQIRSVNPLISLFGRWGLMGKAGIGNAFPTDEGVWGLFGEGARTIMFERDESLLDLLEPDQVERLERIIHEQAEASIDIQSIKTEQAFLRQLFKTADKKAAQELRDKIGVLDEQIKARKERKSEAYESIRRPIDPYEAFITGAELHHKMVIRNATDTEAGLFIAALIRFASHPRLGGHSAHNCGLIEATWQLTTWRSGELAPICLGEISLTQEGVKIAGHEIENMLNIFKENKDLDFKIC
ncbi:CRISPR-associated protein Csf2 [Salmonella enterica subsp. enterica]|nr:CRISPR-associated protein Csf2 [Salmonella enterica subsp. enterica]MIF51055.1 CRISPR-associated protein Csf2 [Salmonella enterica subsp. enterica]